MLRFRRSRRRSRTYRPGEIALGDAVARERVAIAGLTPGDLGVLAAWRDAGTAAAAAATAAVQARLEAQPRTRVQLAADGSPYGDGARLEAYVRSLFAARLDDAYVAERERLGRAQGALNGDPSLHLVVCDVLREALVRAAADAGATAGDCEDLDEALARLLCLDATLVVEAAHAARVSATVAAAVTARDSTRAREARESRPDAAQRFVAEAGEVLAALAARDLRPRLHGTYGPELDAVKRAVNHTMDDLERTMRAVARVGAEVGAAAREVGAGSQSVAQGAAAQATSLAQVADELRALMPRDAGVRGSVQAMARAVEQVDALARRTAANAEAGAARASALVEEAAQVERMAGAYVLREKHSAAPHPRRRRTDVAPTEPVPQAPAAEPEPGAVPTRFRRERRRSLFTDN